MMEPSDAERAYAAGLFDGEGSVGAYRGRPAECKLWLTDEDLLERFAATVGVGRIKGPYRRGPASRKPMWAWSVRTHAEVAEVFRLIGPWLGQRRTEAFEQALGSWEPAYRRTRSWLFYGKRRHELSETELRVLHRHEANEATGRVHLLPTNWPRTYRPRTSARST
jgi:hypothetical protein